jgi:hypothetical protein
MEGDDLLYVSLQGNLVACDSLPDAEAVKRAQELLRNGSAAFAPPNELKQLSCVLRKLGQREAAHELYAVASRMAAAELIGRSSVS